MARPRPVDRRGFRAELQRARGFRRAAGARAALRDLPQGPSRLPIPCFAAGTRHTVLLVDDGTSVAYGDNSNGQCAVAALAAGRRYIGAAAGHLHTVLLVDDGTAVAIGYNGNDQCAVPALAAGRRYVAERLDPAVVRSILLVGVRGGVHVVLPRMASFITRAAVASIP